MAKKSVNKIPIDKLQDAFNSIFLKQTNEFYKIIEKFRDTTEYNEFNYELSKKEYIQPNCCYLLFTVTFRLMGQDREFHFKPAFTMGFKDLLDGYEDEYRQLNKEQRLAYFKFNMLKALYIVKNTHELYSYYSIPCKKSHTVDDALTSFIEEVSLQCLKDNLFKFFSFQELIWVIDSLSVMEPDFFIELDTEEMKKYYTIEEETKCKVNQ